MYHKVLDKYPNLEMMMAGAVSGHHTEWPLMRKELTALIEAYEDALDLAYAEREFYNELSSN